MNIIVLFRQLFPVVEMFAAASFLSVFSNHIRGLSQLLFFLHGLMLPVSSSDTPPGRKDTGHFPLNRQRP